MTVQAQLADGTTLQFPDGTDPTVVQATVKKMIAQGSGADSTQRQPLQAPDSPGLFDRIGQDINYRQGIGKQIDQNAPNDPLGPLGTEIHHIGNTFGGIGDAIGGAASLATSGIGHLAALAPSITTPLANGMTGALQKLGDTEIGQQAKQDFGAGSSALNQFSQTHPVGREYLNDAANALPYLNGGTADAIAGGLDAAKTGVQAGGGMLSAVGDAISASGDASIAKKSSAFLHDLITPKDTPTVKNQLFSQASPQGLLRKIVADPTAQEQSIMDSVAQTGVKPGNTLSANYNLIKDANSYEAKSLASKLSANEVPIDQNGLVQKLIDLKDKIKSTPYGRTTDGGDITEAMFDGALQNISDNALTNSGLFKARKDFDAWAKDVKNNPFDAKTTTPATDAIYGIRNILNQTVAEATPNVDLMSSLQHQSNLWDAQSAIESKGGKELGSNIITRTAQKVEKAIPGKTALGKAAVATGLGAGLVTNPAAVGILGTGYLGYKAATAPILRKGLGSALSLVGNAIK